MRTADNVFIRIGRKRQFYNVSIAAKRRVLNDIRWSSVNEVWWRRLCRRDDITRRGVQYGWRHWSIVVVVVVVLRRDDRRLRQTDCMDKTRPDRVRRAIIHKVRHCSPAIGQRGRRTSHMPPPPPGEWNGLNVYATTPAETLLATMGGGGSQHGAFLIPATYRAWSQGQIVSIAVSVGPLQFTGFNYRLRYNSLLHNIERFACTDFDAV